MARWLVLGIALGGEGGVAGRQAGPYIYIYVYVLSNFKSNALMVLFYLGF